MDTTITRTVANAVTRWALTHRRQTLSPHETYTHFQMKTLADARDQVDELELAAALSQIQADIHYANQVIGAQEDMLDHVARLRDASAAGRESARQEYENADDMGDVVKHAMSMSYNDGAYHMAQYVIGTIEAINAKLAGDDGPDR